MDKIEAFAKEFERDVRDAFVHAYGPPQRKATVDESIRSSYLPPGHKLGWTDPDPEVVLVLTEYAWVQDPWSYDEAEMPLWQKAMDYLHANGYPHAWHESINAAVHAVMADKPRWSFKK